LERTLCFVNSRKEGRIESRGNGRSAGPTIITTVLIRPFRRHRAIGTLKSIKIVIPVFDRADEWSD
jgi:hypothetical protein